MMKWYEMGLNIIRRIAGSTVRCLRLLIQLGHSYTESLLKFLQTGSREGLWQKGLSKLFTMSCSHESIDCCFILSLCLVRMTESCAIPKYLVEKYGAVVLIKTGRVKTKQQQNEPGHRKVSSTAQWSTTILYILKLSASAYAIIYIHLYYIIL